MAPLCFATWVTYFFLNRWKFLYEFTGIMNVISLGFCPNTLHISFLSSNKFFYDIFWYYLLMMKQTTSRRLSDRKVARFEKNVTKRGSVPETVKKGNDYPVGPIVLGFFVFVVVGSCKLHSFFIYLWWMVELFIFTHTLHNSECLYQPK